MITRIAPDKKTPPWQHALTQAISQPEILLAQLGLSPQQCPQFWRTPTAFPLKVPQSFVRRMQKGDPNDPLLLQVLPQIAENNEQPVDYRIDPVGDHEATRTPGVIHKYHGRVLLITTGACGIHCRYCFRRHFPYNASNAMRHQWQNALDYIASDNSIEEVILSGGDPLILPDQKLEQLAQALEAIPHIKRLRLHTRLPVILPERVCHELIDWLTATRLKPIVVVHVNHPAELNDETRQHLQSLTDNGINLLNQSVLLKGVNDNAKTLAELSHALFETNIQPYYLHILDKVAGAAHFEITPTKAQAIYTQLCALLPGYMTPKLSLEIAGRDSKTILGQPVEIPPTQ